MSDSYKFLKKQYNEMKQREERRIGAAEHERGKQEGERLGLERAAEACEQYRGRPHVLNYKLNDSRDEGRQWGAYIRALASTPSADWVMVERSKLEAIRRLAAFGGPELDGIRADLDALLKDKP